jgi:hypothetical protein
MPANVLQSSKLDPPQNVNDSDNHLGLNWAEFAPSGRLWHSLPVPKILAMETVLSYLFTRAGFAAVPEALMVRDRHGN